MNRAITPGSSEPAPSRQEERRRRILDVTIALASEGGYDAVQMRVVARRAEVALGTLYRYFPSKVHLLVAALAREFERTNEQLHSQPFRGRSRAERVGYVLRGITQVLERDPRLTEALTRAFMLADASVATQVAVVEAQVSQLLVGAMRDPADPPDGPAGDGAADEDVAIAKVIGDVWLAGLVQWVSGRATAEDVQSSMSTAVGLLLRD